MNETIKPLHDLDNNHLKYFNSITSQTPQKSPNILINQNSERLSSVDLIEYPIISSNGFLLKGIWRFKRLSVRSVLIQNEMSNMNGGKSKQNKQANQTTISWTLLFWAYKRPQSLTRIGKHQRHRAIVLLDIQLIFIHGLSAHNKGSGFSRSCVDLLFSLESQRKERDGESKKRKPNQRIDKMKEQ